MKILFLSFVSLLLFSPPLYESRLNLICHMWKQVAIKDFNKHYRPVGPDIAAFFDFKRDGKYIQSVGGSLISGKWKFASDSNKLSFFVERINGKPSTDDSFDKKKPVDS